MSELAHYLSHTAAMWWLTGYSNGRSGEELANPQHLDPQYKDDYQRGYDLGVQRREGR